MRRMVMMAATATVALACACAPPPPAPSSQPGPATNAPATTAPTSPTALPVAPTTVRVDAAFGQAGLAPLSSAAGLGGALDVRGLVVDPWSRIYVTGAAADGSGRLSRMLPDGRPDPTFDIDGHLDLGTAAPLGLAAQPDGTVVLLTSQHVPGPAVEHRTLVRRFLPSGALDPSFGRRGVFTRVDQTNDGDSFQQLGVLPDGGVALVGSTARGATVLRLTAHGEVDPGFGTEGEVVLPFGPSVASADSVLGMASGDVLVTSDDQVARLHADGRPDPSFGSGGVAPTPPHLLAQMTMLDAAGHLLQAATGLDFVHQVARLRADGRLDGGFGDGGTAWLDFADLLDRYPDSDGPDFLSSAAQLPDGRIVTVGHLGDAITVGRLTTGGRPDPTFGTAGRVLIEQPAGVHLLLSPPVAAVASNGDLIVSIVRPDGSTRRSDLLRLHPEAVA